MTGLLFLASLVGTMQSGIQEHKGVLYQAPTGWQVVTEGQTRVFSPRGLKEPDFLSILLTPSMVATSETPRKQFDSTVAAASIRTIVLSAGDVDEKNSGKVSVFTQVQLLDSKERGKHGRLFAMLFVEKRKALVIVTFSNESILKKYRDQVSQFITTLRLKGQTVKASIGTVISPPPKGGGGGSR